MEAHCQMNSSSPLDGGNFRSADEVNSYRRYNYVIPALHVGEEQMAVFDDAVAYLLEANPHVPTESLLFVHIVDNKAENRRSHQTLLDLAPNAEFLDLVEQAIDPNIVLWGCHLFCKPGATDREVPLHQAGHFWSFRPLATCTIWLAIDKVDRVNSCMRVIPGSHAAPTLFRHHADRDPALALYEELDAD